MRRKLLVLSIGAAVAGVASAASNFVANGSFEMAFTDGLALIVDPTVDGSYAYGSAATTNVYLPGWHGDQNWGYAVNPDGGANQFGFLNNPPDASDGNVAYGAGHPAHYFGIWQNVTSLSGLADGMEDYKLSFDFYHTSNEADNWIGAKIQMLDGPGGLIEASFGGIGVDPGLSLDTWHSIVLIISANTGFDGSQIQIFLNGSGGSFIDNVRFESPRTYEIWVAGYGLEGTNALRSTDVESDGMENLLEYVLGGNPTNDDSAAVMPTLEATLDSMKYVYRRRIDAAVRGLDYGLVLNTNDLLQSAWTNVGTTFETTNVVIDADFESVTNTIPVTGDVGFVNLEVEESIEF